MTGGGNLLKETRSERRFHANRGAKYWCYRKWRFSSEVVFLAVLWMECSTYRRQFGRVVKCKKANGHVNLPVGVGGWRLIKMIKIRRFGRLLCGRFEEITQNSHRPWTSKRLLSHVTCGKKTCADWNEINDQIRQVRDSAKMKAI